MPENYTFEVGSTGEDLVQVTLHPKRNSRLLVKGHIFLGSDGDLVRIEGQPADNPSFWTRRVDIVRRYGRIAGVRVPIALESIAQVRIAGRSTFRMSYDYLTVNGQKVRSDDRCSVSESHRVPDRS